MKTIAHNKGGIDQAVTRTAAGMSVKDGDLYRFQVSDRSQMLKLLATTDAKSK